MYILNRIPITTLFLSWEFLERFVQGNVKDQVDLIITDIEMPLMDGHHLTEKIKKNSVLNDIPIIIFSSLISADLLDRKSTRLNYSIVAISYAVFLFII